MKFRIDIRPGQLAGDLEAVTSVEWPCERCGTVMYAMNVRHLDFRESRPEHLDIVTDKAMSQIAECVAKSPTCEYCEPLSPRDAEMRVRIAQAIIRHDREQGRTS